MMWGGCLGVCFHKVSQGSSLVFVLLCQGLIIAGVV